MTGRPPHYLLYLSVTGADSDWDALLDLIEDAKLDISRKDLAKLFEQRDSHAFKTIDREIARSLGRVQQVEDEVKRLQVKFAGPPIGNDAQPAHHAQAPHVSVRFLLAPRSAY